MSSLGIQRGKVTDICHSWCPIQPTGEATTDGLSAHTCPTRSPEMSARCQAAGSTTVDGISVGVACVCAGGGRAKR